MTMARAHLVDPSVARWYHCVSRCVRRAFMLDEAPGDESGEEPLSPKEWIEKRLQELAGIFAVGVAGFSVMDNEICPWSVVRCPLQNAGRRAAVCPC